MYKILGSDQKEYGPITGEQLRQWITQDRVNGQSMVLIEGATEWRPLATIPEFAAAPAPLPPPDVPVLDSLPVGAAATPAKTSGVAVTALVLGILGFCTMGLTSLVGLVLGIVSLGQIKKSQGRICGRGLGIAGICLSIVSLMIGVVAIVIWFLVFSQNASRPSSPPQAKFFPGSPPGAPFVPCVGHLKQLSLAARTYASDHQEIFPPSAKWCDLLQPELGANAARVLRCNADTSSQRSSYGYNAKLSGTRESQVSGETVMFFEIDGGWNVSGGPELVMKTQRHGQIINIVLVNGTVQQVTSVSILQLRWNP